MKGKICMVTGANSGIGFHTALSLARLSAEVIMVCRNPEKGSLAREEIMEESGNHQVHLVIADLSSQAEIRRLAEEFKQSFPRLDVLINNAGIALNKRRETADGLEMILAVNHLAPFLLTGLLLESIQAAAPSRIINVSSFAHAWTDRIAFEDLQSEDNFSPTRVYAQSKLALLMFSYELARRLEGSRITVNVLNPGMLRTNLGGDVTGPYRVLRWLLLGVLGAEPAKGAQTSIYLASSDEVEGITGKYFSKGKLKKSTKASYDRDAWVRLWEASEELTGQKFGMIFSPAAAPEPARAR